MKKLSIIIPIYNEKDTILNILKVLDNLEIPLEKEIILIDDSSTDGTVEILENINKLNYKIIFSEKNAGKGASLKKGFLAMTGDVAIIQDADLEYDPNEYSKLLKPILENKADIVYGSRFVGGEAHRVLYFWHFMGNRFLTFFSNMFTGLNLTDMETCYKVFRKEVMIPIAGGLESKRFGIEPEMTAKFARGKWRIYEVGISYNGRTYEEGKKIGWKDGFSAIWTILKFGIFK